MIRGSTYSAVMHLSILAIILFGLPSLMFIFPKFNLKESPVRVAVMTPQDADKLSQKSPPTSKQNEKKTTKKEKKEKLKKKKRSALEASELQATKVGAATSGAKKENKSKAGPGPSPDKPEKSSGGLSFVREADPKAETQDKVTTTKNPTNDAQKAVPEAGSAEDFSRHSAKPNKKQEQVKLTSNEKTHRTPPTPASTSTSNPIQFSLVRRPSTLPSDHSTKAKSLQQTPPQTKPNDTKASTPPGFHKILKLILQQNQQLK